MKKVYLDYAATTPLDEDVFKVMMPYFKDNFGNPMSIHSLGRTALEAVDKARSQVADFLNCDSSEIIFTSGATESNNLAIKGVVEKYLSENRGDKKPHIITTSFEHHCVLTSIQSLERSGKIEATYLPIYKDGIIKTSDVKKAIKSNTILVSVMYVNNEIGTVQPIEKIGSLIKKINSKIPNTKYKILFHTDATQAINYFDCNVKEINVDLLSFSGHKIYGPKGVGVLYVKKGTPIKRIQDGGEQEDNMRAGTHNVPGIVGLGNAVSKIKIQKSKVKNIMSLRDYLIKRVLKEIPDSYLNGSREKRSPANANFRFENVEGESLTLALDLCGIAASTGSACSSSILAPSHVLMSLGLKPEESHGSLRLSLGKYTKKEEIDYAVKKLKEIVGRFRKISGDVLEEFK